MAAPLGVGVTLGQQGDPTQALDEPLFFFLIELSLFILFNYVIYLFYF